MLFQSNKNLMSEIASLPIPDGDLQTPCLVVLEEAMLHNLHQTAEHAGGIDRLMPHVKTHRALWVAEWMIANGITSLKAATPIEVELALQAGAEHVLWAYPTANGFNIDRVIDAANGYPEAIVKVLFDCEAGYRAWKDRLQIKPAENIRFVLDLDPGMGRTGTDIEGDAAHLARRVHQDGLFAGIHIYDGHIQDADKEIRIEKNRKNVARVTALISSLRGEGINDELIASGSYSFDIWPESIAGYVSPGSFIYSSAQHQHELSHLKWKIGAYVIASVVSVRPGSATLDAGSKAISPDMLMRERFSGAGAITGMSEEHSVVKTDELKVGDRLALVSKHTCTTVYLYPRALVKTLDGRWEYRHQLGNMR